MKKLFVILLMLSVSIGLFAYLEKVEIPVRDISPNVSNHNSGLSLTDEMWDLQFSFDATAASGAAGNAGSEFDGTYFYTTRWASNLIHKYDINGVLVEAFSIPGVTGLRDLAYDGTHFYGGNAGNVIYEMDFDAHTLVASISSSVAVRAIAYNEDLDAFFVSNFADPVGLIGHDGTTIATFNCGLSATYGFAYDNVTSGGPYLWIFDQGAGAGAAQLIHQMDALTYTMTGVTHNVQLELPDPSGIAGGLFLTTEYEAGYVTLGGLQQGVPDQVFCYELAVSADPLAPGAPTNVTVTPNATGLLQATISWTCPTLQVNGDPLTDLDEMRVYRGEDLIYTDTNPTIGAAGNYTDMSVPSAGQYTYKVVGSNDVGEGIPATVTVWVGQDIPNAVTNLTLTDVSTTTLIAQLDWTNPTTGFHGGYFAGVTGYDIERSDGATFNVAGSMTSWQDTSVPAPGVYCYTVTPYNGSGSGPSTTSPQVGIGVSIIQVGNQEITDWQIPMDIWYDNSIVECVYDMEWIGTDMLVNTVGFHSNITSTVPPFNLEIWLGEVDIDDLSGGWLNDSQLTMVYDGTINVPPGDQWVELPLDTPFEYTYSNNLVMGIIKDDDEYYSTADVWWTTQSGTANRTLHQYNDTEEFSIQSPPTSSNAKTTYPDVRFYYSVLAHGDVGGVVTNSANSNPIAGVEVCVGSWGPATTNATGAYLIEDIVTGLQPVTATKEGFYNFFGEVTVLADQVVTYNIVMDANLFGGLDGTVTDADTGDPLVGAEINAISAGGYEYDAVTDTNGDYVINNVVAETYDVYCSFPNYPTEVEEDVVVLDGQTTTVDFELEGYAFWCNFENGDGGLISDNAAGWQWGAFTSGPMAGYSGTNGWGTVIGGNYPSSANFRLDTPVPFFVESPLAALEFWHWYDIEAGFDGGNVKVSTDGGTSWAVITPLTGYTGTANTANPLNGEPIFCNTIPGNFWAFVEFDLSPYQGQSVMLRWHFGSDSSVEYPGWYIDDVSISGCTVPNQGSLEGTVVEFGTGTPIQGAVVTVGTSLNATTGANGSYSIPAIWPGDYDITCVAPLYLDSEELGFTIVEGVNTLDFSMLWSELAVNVTALNSYLPPDEMETQTFTITNDGPGDLEYNISLDFPAEISVRRIPSTHKIETSRTASNVPAQLETKKMNNGETALKAETGLAPRQIFNPTASQPVVNPNPFRDPDYQAYAYNAYDPTSAIPQGPVTYILNNPAGLTSLASTTSMDFIAGACWVAEEETWYGSQYGGGLYSIDITTGAMTYIATTISLSGIEYDDASGIMYGTDGASLYTVNWTTGATTLIGSHGIGDTMIGIAGDGEGNMYGVSVSFSAISPLYLINLSTGNAASLGSTGGQLLYAQDIAFDKDAGTLYSAAYFGNGTAPGLYTINTTTCAMTLIGNFPGGMEVSGFAIPYNSESWVSVTNNASGVVAGNGGSIEVEVTFDSAELLIGDFLTADLLIHNNSNYTTDGDDYVIPVTLTITGFIPPTNLFVDVNTWLFTWDAPPGPNLLGYNVFLDDMAIPIGTTASTQWQYTDLVGGQPYVAGVSAVYDDGVSQVMQYQFTPVNAGNIIPLVTELKGNFPNPFNPDTKIAFSLNKQSHVQITVYNIKGQLVRTLVDEERDADNYTVIWNGTDNSRKPVSSGVYFYKMKTDGYVSTKKMIMMK
ncbi:MAG: carboxypeptidase regulatory-like domain-containing protein [Candidatus Cloacimonadales bacterium]|nr:carboxypeptidase regulatory-like domain-containing protein [Candidatus Cloacimonadales bacterium]